MHYKIANIILDGRFGGPQNQILQIAERLKKYEIESVIIIPKKESELFYSKLLERNISVQRFNLHRLTKYLPHLICYVLFFLPEVFSIYRYLKRKNIKLVHCNSSWQIKGIIAGKMARSKIIWHLQDTNVCKPLKMVFNILAQFCCDGIIVAGNRVKECYLNNNILKGKKNTTIQAPVDTSFFVPDRISQDKVLAHSSGIKITTVGNIGVNKGLEYFIEMANILNSKYEGLYFYIVGSHLDSQKHYSRRLFGITRKYNLKNIYFYGHCDNVPGILKATDIYVCSSIREASPMSLWEAMAMEKAIVSTDVGDVGVYVKNGKNGFVVQQRDARTIAEKVGIFIENKELRDKFGKLARATAVKKLDLEISADKYRSFYLEVLRM
jgi:glycosyltransferase involved in cell wall biosynthesis